MTDEFYKLFNALPKDAKSQARNAYRRFQKDSSYRSLHFKPIKRRNASLRSVRIGRDYRALARLDGDTVIWFWIGTKAEYDHLIDRIDK